MKSFDAKSLLVGATLAILGLLAMGQRSMTSETGRYQASVSQDGQVVVVCDTESGRVIRLLGNAPVAEFEVLARVKGR